MSSRSKKDKRDKRKARDAKRAARPLAAAARPAEDPVVEVALRSSYEAMQRGQHEKAEKTIRKALADRPLDRRLMANLVAALENQGRAEDAERAAVAAVKAHPDDAQCRNNLGAVLKFQGRLDEARDAFRRATELAPRYASAWRNLAGVKTFTSAADPDLVAMRELLPKVPRSEDARTSLYFAIAKACDEVGELDEAYAHFERGNRHRRGRIRFELADLKRLVDETIELWPAERFAAEPVPDTADDAPILVVGMPRSGSTLVEQILASHPDVQGVGEVPDLPRSIDTRVEDTQQRVRTVAHFSDEDTAAVGRLYGRSLAGRAPGAKRVVDKYLTNFVYLGFLRRALPNARFVHVRRNPMDNGFGCFRTHFTSHVPYAYDFDSIAGTYAETHRLLAHWAEVIPEALIEVDYEAFVGDLEGETRALLDRLGLEWSDACLRFHETERRVNSASATQVRRPLYDSSVGRWRPYAKHLRPLAAAFEAHDVETDFESAEAGS